MYNLIVLIHSILRWVVLISLLFGIWQSVSGLITNRAYTTTDKWARVLVNTLSHTQLLIGFTLYFVLSPITGYFIKNGSGGNFEITFFGIYHIIMMFAAVVVITIGGAVSKRATTDQRKFRVIAIYFSVALFLILMAIPWFRPLLRNF